MSDDKNKQGDDRRTVAAGEDYEVDDFAQKHGLDREAARELIAKHGDNRKVLDAAAEGVKLARGGSFNPNAKA